MKQKVLVVEDNDLLRDLVRMNLEKNGYEVVEAGDGEEAKEVFMKTHPCLIILDLMLPKMSGEAFCEWILQKERNAVSIIMMSAKAKVHDKIAGLRMGADDYITKPFDPDELTAHVDAVLRRTGQYCQKIVHDGLCIKPRKGEVLLYDENIRLTRHEFQLLYFFMQHPNIIHTREQLIEHLYPSVESTILDRTIDAHIKKLREKIEDVPSKPKRIETVRGMGYKYVTA